MLLEVLLQLLGGKVHTIAHLLIVGVILLGGGQHLAQVVHWPLDWLHLAGFWALNHDHRADNSVGGGDVEEHRFLSIWSHQDRRRGHHAFELKKSFVRLVIPLKVSGFLHELIEGKSLLP